MCRSPHQDTLGWCCQQDSRKSLPGFINRKDSRWMVLGRAETSIPVHVLQTQLLNYWTQSPWWRWKKHKSVAYKVKTRFRLRWKPQTLYSSFAITHSCPCKKIPCTGWLMNTESDCSYLWRPEVNDQDWCFCICWVCVRSIFLSSVPSGCVFTLWKGEELHSGSVL